MAEIVFGLGSSHGPLLSTPPDKWYLRREADRMNPAHPFRGGTYTFDELVALRKDDGLEDENTIEVRTERYERCQAQLDALGDRIAEVDPDVVLIVGDDQHEWFHDDIQPSFTVFHGDGVLNKAFDAAKAEKRPPGVIYSMRACSPDSDQIYPGVPELALRVIDQAIEDEFDVATSKEMPNGTEGVRGIGHAFGFIYRRILRDEARPMLPIVINTFFPPNQPSPRRCYAFGQSIGRAIRSWPSDSRVAVVASGGLSHFVIDEDFDRRILEAMLANDAARFTSEPAHFFRSGTSETKNWIITAGILAETGLKMDLLDYVPCYRSEAGTGNAMAFATWT